MCIAYLSTMDLIGGFYNPVKHVTYFYYYVIIIQEIILTFKG